METLQQVADVFIKRGWDVDIKTGRQPDQIDVDPQGLVECGDERKPVKALSKKGDTTIKQGPKIFGAAYGTPQMEKSGNAQGFKAGLTAIKDTGFTPSVHGDDHGGIPNCGQRTKWEKGVYPELPYLKISPQEGVELTLKAGGAYVELGGPHEGTDFNFNTVNYTTRKPDGTTFQCDAWFLLLLGRSLTTTAENAAITVEALTGIRHVNIWG
jgi:hypothetical protein